MSTCYDQTKDSLHGKLTETQPTLYARLLQETTIRNTFSIMILPTPRQSPHLIIRGDYGSNDRISAGLPQMGTFIYATVPRDLT